MAKKTRISKTSIAAYSEIIRSGLIKREQSRVYALFQKITVPHNRRQLQEITGLPINHLCRILNTLVSENKIEVCHDAPCPYTNKTVHFYQLIPSEQTAAA